MSPFAFSTGTAEARSTLGVAISSLTRLGGCSSGVGDTSAGFRFREPGRRDTGLVFSAGLGVGRGWKAFETEWPTFLKKSPTGSACTHGSLRKNSAATGNETQRERIKRLIWSSAFNVKAGFSATIRTYGKQKVLGETRWRSFKRDNATGATAVYRRPTRQKFRRNHHQKC
jgi:hypothetical protein